MLKYTCIFGSPATPRKLLDTMFSAFLPFTVSMTPGALRRDAAFSALYVRRCVYVDDHKTCSYTDAWPSIRDGRPHSALQHSTLLVPILSSLSQHSVSPDAMAQEARGNTPGHQWRLISLLSLCQLAEEGLRLPVVTQLINLLHTQPMMVRCKDISPHKYIAQSAPAPAPVHAPGLDFAV